MNTAVDATNTLGRGGHELVNTTFVSAGNLSGHLIDGVKETGEHVLTTGSNMANIVRNRANNSGDHLSSGLTSAERHIQKTTDNIMSGGGNVSGVSILNLNNDSSRMLIPTNFLTSKHVYFVRYQPNGTSVYNYKLNMKGGNVHYLKHVAKNQVWTANNYSDSMPDNVLIQGKQILNNLINDLKTTQFGGYVEQRIMDKDSYYEEYKNYKLKYLSLKNNN